MSFIAKRPTPSRRSISAARVRCGRSRRSWTNSSPGTPRAGALTDPPRGLRHHAVAMYEFSISATCPHVAINEAVEIAKKYETPETVKFMNGILGSFVRAEISAE